MGEGLVICADGGDLVCDAHGWMSAAVRRGDREAFFTERWKIWALSIVYGDNSGVDVIAMGSTLRY